MQQVNEKYTWADNLRALATIAVIVLHASSAILNKYGAVAQHVWWTGNLFDSLVRFCVPVFLMLTGALVLPREHELVDFWKRRVGRIVMPFLFWSIIYILYDLILRGYAGDSLGASAILKYTFVKLKNGASFHLWYIYMVIGIYLFIPVVSKWVVNSRRKEIWYYVIIWAFVILIGLPTIRILKPNIDFVYFTGFLGYLVLGYLLMTTRSNARTKFISLALVSVGIASTAIGTYLLTSRKGHFDVRLYKYLSPNVIMAATGVFLFFRHQTFESTRVRPLVKYICQYSYGIYLVHVLVLSIIAKLNISWQLIHPLVGIPVTTLICLVLSSLIVHGVSKLPWGNYVSG